MLGVGVLGLAFCCAGGCSSGGSVYTPPPIVDAVPLPPPPPPEPDPLPDQPAESPRGGSGPGGAGVDATPYTGSMNADELLARSAMAYGELDAYLDEGLITIIQPSRRNEYVFRTFATQGEDFEFVVNSTAGSPLPNLEIRRAGQRFETVRSGTYSQAASL